MTNRIYYILCCVVLLVLVCANQLVMSQVVDENYNSRDGQHVPCKFFDTVNITSGTRFENGSYMHEGMLIPSHLTGIYDYVYLDLVTRIDVEPHMRGCVCQIRPCISFCCPWGTVYNANQSTCVNSTGYMVWPEPLLNITLFDETISTVRIFDHYAVQSFRPCEQMYALEPEIYPHDEYRLFENGSMLRLEDMMYLSKNEYCMMPTAPNDTDIVYILNPANCQASTEYSTMKTVNAYAMLFSIPFMVLTIIVYLSVPELRNQHGKSLVCYLFGLIIGYTCLGYVALQSLMEPTSLSCKMIGYTAYYSFMAAFFWLSVISFDLWHNFRGTRRFQEKKRFLVYSLYAWGIPIVFLIFTWYAQEMADIPAYYKPGIGGGEYCWLDMRTWSAMIYFFGPILAIIVANMAMFVMTATKIHRVQQEMARIMARDDCTRNLRSEKDRFGLFLRLFIVMGVTWSLEIVSYFTGPDKAWTRVFYISDICNAMQGFLIFMLFVMKQKVKQLVTNRYSSKRKGELQSQYSTKTTTSSLANLSLTCATPSAAADKPLMIRPDQRTSNFTC